MNKIKNFFYKYRHGAILLYFFVYMIWFTYLEKNVTKYTVVYSKYDDLIPFMEIFVIPYILWFAFIFITVTYFFLHQRQIFINVAPIFYRDDNMLNYLYHMAKWSKS